MRIMSGMNAIAGWNGNSGAGRSKGPLSDRKEAFMDFFFEMAVHAVIYVIKHILFGR